MLSIASCSFLVYFKIHVDNDNTTHMCTPDYHENLRHTASTLFECSHNSTVSVSLSTVSRQVYCKSWSLYSDIKHCWSSLLVTSSNPLLYPHIGREFLLGLFIWNSWWGFKICCLNCLVNPQLIRMGGCLPLLWKQTTFRSKWSFHTRKMWCWSCTNMPFAYHLGLPIKVSQKGITIGSGQSPMAYTLISLT